MSNLIMKFGGASFLTPGHFKAVADIAIERKKQFNKIVIVVSAMANKTRELIELAKEVNPNPPSREYDMLVTVGERISISLLAMALAARGEKAVSFTGSQSGIMTSNEHSNARVLEVRPRRLLPVLDSGQIAIVAGFQGCSMEGEITTLGGNGSDISAVALAVCLEADRVDFFKDVGGIYDRDPKLHSNAAIISHLTYDEAFALVNSGGRILHPRCLALAKENCVPLCLYSLQNPDNVGTTIEDQRLEKSCAKKYECEYNRAGVVQL